MEIKAEEIRLEIISCFVEKHEYWSKRRGGKNWIAHIRGLDPYYGYKREFLQPVLMGRKKVFQLEDFVVGEVYEICSEYYLASRKRFTDIRDTFVCREITETHVVLEYISQKDVVKRFTEGNSFVAETLVRQLLRIVDVEEARNLIESINGEVSSGRERENVKPETGIKTGTGHTSDLARSLYYEEFRRELGKCVIERSGSGRCKPRDRQDAL